MEQTRAFPTNYASDTVTVLKALSITDGKDVQVVGSAAMRAQQYNADVDAFEVAEGRGASKIAAIRNLAARFKDAVRRVQGLRGVFLADIKAGVIPVWQVIPESAQIRDNKVIGYSGADSRAKVDDLVRDRVMTEADGRKARVLLKDRLTPSEFLVARDLIRPHIVRWLPAEVLRGTKTLPDGSVYSLEEAIASPGVTKIDTIAWLNGNHFSDMSMIYTFTYRGQILNETNSNLIRGLQEDVAALMIEGKPFKALKRRFSLAKAQGDVALMERILPILNGDLGRLYAIASDIQTLLYMLESYSSLPYKQIVFEIDQLRDRFAKIYSLHDFLYIEPKLLSALSAALKQPNTKAGHMAMAKQLAGIVDQIEEIIARHTPTGF